MGHLNRIIAATLAVAASAAGAAAQSDLRLSLAQNGAPVPIEGGRATLSAGPFAILLPDTGCAAEDDAVYLRFGPTEDAKDQLALVAAIRAGGAEAIPTVFPPGGGMAAAPGVQTEFYVTGSADPVAALSFNYIVAERFAVHDGRSVRIDVNSLLGPGASGPDWLVSATPFALLIAREGCGGGPAVDSLLVDFAG